MQQLEHKTCEIIDWPRMHWPCLVQNNQTDRQQLDSYCPNFKWKVTGVIV